MNQKVLKKFSVPYFAKSIIDYFSILHCIGPNLYNRKLLYVAFITAYREGKLLFHIQLQFNFRLGYFCFKTEMLDQFYTF